MTIGGSENLRCIKSLRRYTLYLLYLLYRNEIISGKYLNEEGVRGHHPLRSVVVQSGVPGNPPGRAASRHSIESIFVKKCYLGYLLNTVLKI